MFRKYLLGALCIGLMASCNKSKEKTSPEEGYKSTTKNTEEWNENNLQKAVYPDFHMHYSADLSEKEATAKWEKDFEGYLQRKEASEGDAPLSCHNFKYTISTYTGTGTNEGTDGSVVSHQQFYVNGVFDNQTVTLNNPGDDREGGWDFYYITKEMPNTWRVRLKRIQLALKGTDGWYVERWNVKIDGAHQNCSAFGVSKSDNPNFNTWFDNPTSTDWDLRTIWVNSEDEVHFF